MFLKEWREFPSAPCLAGGKENDDSSRLYVVEIYIYIYIYIYIQQRGLQNICK
jgi:hypothetical protein